MDDENLAAVFQPSLLLHNNHILDPSEYSKCKNIIRCLISKLPLDADFQVTWLEQRKYVSTSYAGYMCCRYSKFKSASNCDVNKRNANEPHIYESQNSKKKAANYFSKNKKRDTVYSKPLQPRLVDMCEQDCMDQSDYNIEYLLSCYNDSKKSLAGNTKGSVSSDSNFSGTLYGSNAEDVVEDECEVLPLCGGTDINYSVEKDYEKLESELSSSIERFSALINLNIEELSFSFDALLLNKAHQGTDSIDSNNYQVSGRDATNCLKSLNNLNSTSYNNDTGPNNSKEHDVGTKYLRKLKSGYTKLIGAILNSK
ncbi:hypothetical protein AX774_g2253 [Zancudomyces culisetae]|uniref:Rho-GAP domain-containing protein n=1 Tax=Zancudomyces culisetae TaxID=1213189 RepID=A0A1R1PTG6_ZANCU|nr:hypothetical protein AX774_g2253 [Zancudomyces culisetae]|eukprot:OMH84234.1 hypothetical protein AX774_g2253 [Zancudomyces culisetae]